MSVNPSASTFRIKVTLKGIRPPIWRRLLVPDTLKLPEFHRVLQYAMGWQNIHLHHFTLGSQGYGIPDFFEPDDTLNERRYTIGDLLTAEHETLLYEYDFGDGWQHQVVLEKILPFDKTLELPCCLQGRRACPPEDIGGPRSYLNFLAAIKDPEHPEHEELRDRVGAEFDPEAFDAAAITQTLQARC